MAVRSDLYNRIFHSKWFFLAAGTFLLFSAWWDLMKGSTVSPYPHNCRTVTRSDNPYQYWFSIFDGIRHFLPGASCHRLAFLSSPRLASPPTPPTLDFTHCSMKFAMSSIRPKPAIYGLIAGKLGFGLCRRSTLF